MANKEFDLGIRDILYKNSSGDYVDADDGITLDSDDTIRFKIVVKNYDENNSLDYDVIVLDKYGERLDRDEEPDLAPRETGNAYLDVKLNDTGKNELTFKIVPVGSGWKDLHPSDTEETRIFFWGNGQGGGYSLDYLGSSDYISYIENIEGRKTLQLVINWMEEDYYYTVTKNNLENKFKTEFKENYDRFYEKLNALKKERKQWEDHLDGKMSPSKN